MKNVLTWLAICCILVSFTPLRSRAAVVYMLNFDSPTGTVVPGPGDIVPAGAVATVDESTVVATPSLQGLQGGNVLSQTLGAAWPNKQGVQITGGPLVQNVWTLEVIVKPDLSGCAYGKEQVSYIYDSFVNDSFNLGDVCLYVNQNTGVLTFAPWGDTTFGKITYSTGLHSGQWYHIAAVIRTGVPQQTELWINGELVGTGNYPAGWETQGQFKVPDHFRIGGWDWPATGRNWQGEIDSICISDKALAVGSFVLLPAPLYGHVDLDGYVGDKSCVALQAQFRAPGSATTQFTKQVFLDSSGDYSIQMDTAGTYDIVFRTPFSLAKLVPNVTIPARVNVSLTDGDVDGNNYIGIIDHSVVSSNHGIAGDQ